MPINVGDGIYLIKVQAKDLPPSAAYIVVDHKIVIIDTGPASGAGTIVDGLKQLGYTPSMVSSIILTHIHIDHGGGIGTVAKQMPQAVVVVHPQGVSHLIDPSRLITSTRLAYGENFENTLGPLLPVPAESIHIAVDNEVISLGGRELRLLFTPGHAPHHLSVWDARSRSLFAGEALGIVEPDTGIVVPSASPPAFDPDAMLQSIDRLERLKPQRLLYAHNGFSSNIGGVFKLARENIGIYSDMLLCSARAGKTMQEMNEELRDWIESSHSIKFEFDFTLQIAGYLSYFKRKGLL